MRTGKSYLDWLKSAPLKISYKGKDIHPLQVEQFKRQAAVIADYYQHHHDKPENTIHSEIGPHSVTLLIPRTQEDLYKKSAGFYSLAKNYLGVVGRPPDYINAVFSCWEGCSDLFKQYSDNVTNYYKNILNNDLFVTHSTSELKGGQKSGIRVIEETSAGVILNGARAMATSAAISDEIFIAPTRLNDEDLDKAIVCAIPSTTPGLHLVCRNSLEGNSSLSSYYDESDALVVLERVFVPWERVFIYRDMALYKSIVKQTGTSLAASLQTNVRAIAKLESIIDLMLAWQDIYPKYRTTDFIQTAGRALRDLQILKSLQNQAIENSQMVHHCMQPNGELIEAAKVYFMERYQKTISSLREGLGPDLFYLFSPSEIDSKIVTELCSQWGITPNAFESRQKVSVVLYDLLNSTFGVRHELYEQFYAGNPKNNVGNYWINYSDKYRSNHLFNKFEQIGALYEENFGPTKQSIASTVSTVPTEVAHLFETQPSLRL
jgi:aromatic ring hydroxylase